MSEAGRRHREWAQKQQQVRTKKLIDQHIIGSQKQMGKNMSDFQKTMRKQMIDQQKPIPTIKCPICGRMNLILYSHCTACRAILPKL